MKAAGSSTVALALLLGACSVASPETEVRDVLGRAAPFELRAGRARVEVTRARFGDVEVLAEGGRARVLAVVDADGRVLLPGGVVALGYVGREAPELERCLRARWCPVGPLLPALAAVVATLAEAPRPSGRRPIAWQIRVERDRALVGEDAEGPGGTRALRQDFELVHEGGAWRRVAPPQRGGPL